MSQWRRCKRSSFVLKLIKLGFIGPYSGAKHQFLVYQNYRLAIPSNNEYSVPQLKMMIREVEHIIGDKISAEDWQNLH